MVVLSAIIIIINRNVEHFPKGSSHLSPLLHCVRKRHAIDHSIPMLRRTTIQTMLNVAVFLIGESGGSWEDRLSMVLNSLLLFIVTMTVVAATAITFDRNTVLTVVVDIHAHA